MRGSSGAKPESAYVVAEAPRTPLSWAKPGKKLARRGVQALWRALGVEEHRRRHFSLHAGPREAGRPVIYFLTPDYDVPAGGVRVIYRHVDILNEAGLAAFVLHSRRGFRCSWFENQTRVTDIGSVRIGPQDLLVVPELDIDLLSRVGPTCRYVIFNQNSHLTWSRADADVAAQYERNPSLAAVVVVSEHSGEMLRQAFPAAPIRRVRLGVDPRLFHPSQEVRANRITYMPRRGLSDAKQVLSTLGGCGLLKNWEVVPLSGLDHAGVASQFRQSKIFLAFTYQEGFGLPAAEAMACGNYVIGHHGFGGREFFSPDYCTPVEAGDTMSFVQAVERAILSEDSTPGWCRSRGFAAAEAVLRQYSLEHERQDVIATYVGLVSSPEPVEALT
jgi:glycosyltransferase involved in cell wall biosynthesis